MNFIWFTLFSLIVFLLSLAFYERFRSTILYALAIGGIVNANFFHAGNFPIDCFGLPFGIDSVIYSLFAFCVAVMLIKTNKKEAYILSASSVIAIMFSALMQLVVDLLTKGSCPEIWTTFLTFTISAAASVVAIVVMIEIVARLKEKKVNNYLLLVIGMVIIAIVNSALYYPLVMLLNGTPQNVWTLMLTSVIGKMISLVWGVVCLLLMNKIEKVIIKRGKQKEVEENIVFADGKQITLEDLTNASNDNKKED